MKLPKPPTPRFLREAKDSDRRFVKRTESVTCFSKEIVCFSEVRSKVTSTLEPSENRAPLVRHRSLFVQIEDDVYSINLCFMPQIDL